MVTIEQILQLPFMIRSTITSQHLDRLGHMNVRYYLGIFADAYTNFAGYLGVDDAYLDEQKKGTMALRHVISYHAEVHAGQTVAVYARLLKYDEKRLHSIQYMLNETTGDVAASIEGLAIHVDLVKRKSIPIPEHLADRMDAIIAELDQLDWQPKLSGGIKL
ncbi:MAG: thioesterase [Chloroflexi bacterium]|nr:thioesterase [Chloroflexota bacterium]